MKNLIKIFLICTLVLLALGVTASAATSGYYTYTVSNGEATITDVNTRISGAVTIPSTLGGYPVTTIGKSAFERCSSLTSVEIGDSVTTIGNLAFDSCYNLTSVEIGDSVTTIGNLAFDHCTKLTNITVSENNNSFSSKNGVLFNKQKTELVCYSVGKTDTSYIIPDSVTTIGDEAFYLCTNLSDLKIPESVTSIGDYAFSYCYSLTSIEIPDSVTTIGNDAFCSCYSLTSVIIPDSVTTIGDDAFYNCTSLTSIEIPDSVTTIGERVLYGCSALEELTIPFVGSERGNSGTSDALFGYIFGTSSYTGGYAVKQYYNNSEYATYYVPTSLKKVAVTDEKVIPYGAFSNCNHISDIVIEGKPTAIMANSFTGFYNLFNVVVKAENVRYVASNIFKGSDFPTMYGYSGSTTETYAKNYNVEFIPLDYYEEYTLSGKAKSINNKVVVNVKVSDKVKDKHLHIALYDSNNKQVDYIIVPTYEGFDEINVVFADNKSAKSAKLFLWESLVSLTPISSSVETEISR